MIKYHELEGYKNCGEIGMFSHVYEFWQIKEPHRIILIRAFDVPVASVYKGVLLSDGRQYEKSQQLTYDEKESLEYLLGEIKECRFQDIFSGTGLAEGMKDWTPIPDKRDEKADKKWEAAQDEMDGE
jgi:hypothetical protein